MERATSGYEQADTVILQGHMDMVAVKDADCPLDLEKDGLIPEIDGAWIQAKGRHWEVMMVLQ